jgi:UrcA family protein
MKTVIAMTAAALVALAAGAAQAQPANPDPAVRVSFADLDLGRAQGRAVLEARIRQAVKLVCPPQPLPNELAKLGVYRDCKGQALAGAKRQLAVIYGGQHLAQSAIQVSAGAN